MSNRIQLTKANLAAIVNNMFNSSGVKSYFGNSGSGSPTRLLIFKGTPLTDAEISALTGGAFLTSRANDVLIDFNYDNLGDTNVGNIAKLKNSTYTAAKASGDATFFVLFTNGGSPAVPTIEKAIVGTISDANGNGDLKLPSVAIVSGKTYRIMPLSFAIPMQYMY